MFSKNDGDSKAETLIGKDTIFHGTISTKGMLRVDGRIDGGINEAAELIIGNTGQIQGDVNAKTVIVGGKITGNISAGKNIELLTKAQVYGDIRTPQLSIAEGAVFEGNCVMTTEKQRVIEVDVKTPQRVKN
ncbi:MAG: polymer-forming cytoskeletal protein [bacterium]